MFEYPIKNKELLCKILFFTSCTTTLFLPVDLTLFRTKDKIALFDSIHTYKNIFRVDSFFIST